MEDNAEIIRWLERHDRDILALQGQHGDHRTYQAEIKIQVDYTAKEVALLSTKIDKILERPQKRYDTAINAIITAVISASITGGGIAYILTKVVQ